MARKPIAGFLVNLAAFIALEAAALTILSKTDSPQQSWLESIGTSMKAGVWNMTEKWIAYFDLIPENERLARENSQLLEKLIKTGFSPNDELARWEKMRGEFDITKAAVITSLQGSQHNYFIIDRGSADNVEVDDGVITANGVMGIIRNVSEHYSRADAFTNSSTVVSAKIGRDGDVGSVKWTGHRQNEAIMGGIPLHAKWEKGDTVYTSGYSAIFPPDIPIGIITGPGNGNGGNSSILNIILLENFGKVHNVFVVKNRNKKEIDSLLK